MSPPRPLFSCALVAIVLFLASGCAPSSEEATTAEGVTLTDGLGREVVVANAPQRVVTIAPGATHVVRAAGALDKLTAVTTADYPESDLAHLPRISALPLDLEAIVGMDPDLILASDQVNDPAHAEMFDALGIPIVYLGADSWTDVHDSILLLGSVFETDAVAQASADSLDSMREALIAITGALEDRPTGIFLVSHITSYSFGQGSYVLDLMEWAGVEPLTRSFETPAPILDDEWVLLNNPDVILGSLGASGSKAALLENHPTWGSLDALRNDRIIDVPASLILTPGPENVRAAWLMARAVHPQLFDTLSSSPFSGFRTAESSDE